MVVIVVVVVVVKSNVSSKTLPWYLFFAVSSITVLDQ